MTATQAAVCRRSIRINIHPDLLCILEKKIIMVISGHFRALALFCAILMSDLRNSALNFEVKGKINCVGNGLFSFASF